jgi:hypothetical protein
VASALCGCLRANRVSDYKTPTLVEVDRAASLLGRLLLGGDDIQTLVAAAVVVRGRGSSGDVRVADTDPRSEEVRIKGSRGWGLV